MTPTDSPATRLKNFMVQIRPQMDHATLAATVCAQVFGLTWPGDHRLVLRRLADVADQAFQVRERTNALPDTAGASVFMADFDQVEAVMAQLGAVGNLQAAQLPRLSDAGWRSLDNAEVLARQHFPEPRLPDDDVATLLEQVRAVIDAVAGSGLDQATQVSLIRRLRTVEDALINVRITGTVGVEEAAEGLVGHIVNQPPARRANPIYRKAGEAASAALIAAAAAAGAMLPQIAAGGGDDEPTPPPKPPAVTIVLPPSDQQPAIESGN